MNDVFQGRIIRSYRYHGKILKTNDPDEMKKLGRQIPNFDVEVWSNEAPTIVSLGNIMKFSQNPELWEILDKTGDKLIVEAADYDPIWGIGLKAEDAILVNQSEWKGLNQLGNAVMEARAFLRDTPSLIVTDQPVVDKKIFAFNDKVGQKTIRLSMLELSDKLGCSVDEIPKALTELKEEEILLEYQPFVKKGMTANRDELLNVFSKFQPATLAIQNSQKLRF